MDPPSLCTPYPIPFGRVEEAAELKGRREKMKELKSIKASEAGFFLMFIGTWPQCHSFSSCLLANHGFFQLTAQSSPGAVGAKWLPLDPVLDQSRWVVSLEEENIPPCILRKAPACSVGLLESAAKSLAQTQASLRWPFNTNTGGGIQQRKSLLVPLPPGPVPPHSALFPPPSVEVSPPPPVAPCTCTRPGLL